MQVKHQLETIAQLHQAAQQWRDRFIRVDEERKKVQETVTRIDGILSNQLSVRTLTKFDSGDLQ